MKAETKEDLPVTCEQHLDAPVRHSWEQTHYLINGESSGKGFDLKHKYECTECGRELSALPLNLAEGWTEERDDES